MIKISNDLEISFETNEIITLTENNSNIITKVEPRIMHVLRVLMRNSPNVVLREQLISEVWDNYGGADEALNQAISHLRKLLNDTNKEDRMIDTVVKKGYRFIGKKEIVSVSRKEFKTKNQNSKFWLVIVLSVLLLFSLIIFFLNSKNSIAPESPINKRQNANTLAPDKERN